MVESEYIFGDDGNPVLVAPAEGGDGGGGGGGSGYTPGVEIDSYTFINTFTTTAEVFTAHNDVLYTQDSNGISAHDVSDPSNITQLSSVSLEDNVEDLDDLSVAGDYLYGHTGTGLGPLTIDISDSNNIQVVHEDYSDFWGHWLVEAIDESTVVTGTEPLEVWDTSDPSNPQLVDSIPHYIGGEALVSDGNILYFAADGWDTGADGNVAACYISGNGKPIHLGPQTPPEDIALQLSTWVSMDGNRAYYEYSDANEIAIYDITLADKPVSGGGGGLALPSFPKNKATLLGTYNYPDTEDFSYYQRSVDTDGSYIYYLESWDSDSDSDTEDHLFIIDPDASTPLQSDTVVGQNSEDDPSTIFVDGDYAYIPCLAGDSVTDTALKIYNISDKTSPTQVSSLNYDDLNNRSGSSASLYKADISSDGNTLYVADYFLGFSAFDISDKSTPSYIGGWEIASIDGGQFLTVKDNFLLVMSSIEDSAQLGQYPQAFDISTPDNPKHIGPWDANGTLLREMRYDMSYDASSEWFVTSGWGSGSELPSSATNGVHHFSVDLPELTDTSDISVGSSSSTGVNVESFDYQTSFSLGYNIGAGIVDNDVLYLYDGDNIQIKSYDVSDTSNIQQLSTVAASGDHGGFDTIGDYLIGSYGPEVIDISDPSNMSVLGTGPDSYWGGVAAIDDTTVFAGQFDYGVYDISDPTNPQLITRGPFGNVTVGAAVAVDKVVYGVAEHENLFDESGPIEAHYLGDPQNPVFLGYYRPPDSELRNLTSFLTTEGDRTYQMDRNSDEIHIYDATFGEGTSSSTGDGSGTVPASGSVQLSSGSAVVDTGVSETGATFMLALGIDDPDADVKVVGRVFWDDSVGTYHIEIVEDGTSVGNPTVNYDVEQYS